MSARAQAVIAALLRERGAGKTVCPSEAARRLAGTAQDWRALMGEVHRATDTLLGQGAIAISWNGETLPRRDGPYRIRSAEGVGAGS